MSAMIHSMKKLTTLEVVSRSRLLNLCVKMLPAVVAVMLIKRLPNDENY